MLPYGNRRGERLSKTITTI